jgi:hypothetical protein
VEIKISGYIFTTSISEETIANLTEINNVILEVNFAN